MGRQRDMESCGKCVKWSLVAMNFNMLVCALGIFAVGIWTLADKNFMEDLFQNNLYKSAAAVMTFSGVTTIFLSLLGGIGAFKEIKCMLLGYFVLLFSIFVILVVASALGFVFRQQIDTTLRPEMLSTIALYDPDNPNLPVTRSWDQTQTQLKCCGISAESTNTEYPWYAWKKNNLVNSGNADSKVPASCCKVDVVNGKRLDCAASNPVDETKIYRKDCFSALLEFILDHAYTVGSVAIGIACVMILGMVLSIALFKLIV